MADRDGGSVIVTGASGAIGQAIVAVLVREGRHVVAVDRVAADFGEGVTPVAADVAAEADWIGVGAAAAGRRVTGLVTVAAINRTARNTPRTLTAIIASQSATP
jgi:NAD(P)-dependent dehydrogenase (short-subunit alcohol dehydrogenase family)